jgi:hypothetical protein
MSIKWGHFEVRISRKRRVKGEGDGEMNVIKVYYMHA